MSPPPAFWDIETGGLSGHYSSIYSLGFHRGEEKKVFFARPEVGTTQSLWAKKNVWPSISSSPNIRTERELLTNFASLLESQAGGELIGWNTGYQPIPQEMGRRSALGFDIPMVMTRAAKYPGMQERLGKAFSGVTIRDLGSEMALAVATEVKKYPHLVDPDLFEQAASYADLGASFQTATGSNSRVVAEQLSKARYQFAGWKMEDIHQLAFGEKYQAHEVTSDISALQRLATVPSGALQGPEFVSRWNKLALERRITTKALRGATFGEDPATLFSSQISRGQKWGITGLEEKIQKEVASRGGDYSRVLSGMGIGEEVAETIGYSDQFVQRAIGGRRATLAIGKRVLDWGKKNPLLAGGLVVGAGVMAFSFSGKDDNYNTIEGLRHGGMAERKRRELTDFGSGYRGLVNLFRGTPKFIDTHKAQGNKFLSGAMETILESVRKAEFPNRPARHLSTYWTPNINEATGFALRTRTGRSVVTGQLSRIKAMPNDIFVANQQFLYRISRTIHEKQGFLRNIWSNWTGRGISEEARVEAEKLAREYWQGVDLEKIIQEAGKGRQGRDRLSYHTSHLEVLLPGEIKPDKIWKVNKFDSKFRSIPGRDDAYNTIEGLSHKGIAKDKRHELTDFGSGYRGIIKAPVSLFHFFGQTHAAQGSVDDITKKVLEFKKHLGGKETKNRLVALGLNQEAIKLETEAATSQVNRFLSELSLAKKAGHKQVITVSEVALDAVKNKQMSFKELKGLIRHEQVHLGARTKFGEKFLPGKAPEGWNAVLGELNYNAGRKETFFEEYVAYAAQDKYTRRTRANPLFPILGNSQAEYDELVKNLPESSLISVDPEKAARVGEQLRKRGQAKRASLLKANASRFSGKDDSYNTIEGLGHKGIASWFRKLFTDFGSGWIRKALSKGISPTRIASAASKLGTGMSDMPRLQFGAQALKLLKQDPAEAVKFLRKSQGITSREGERFIFGKELGEGGFGKSTEIYSTRRHGKFVLKEFKNIVKVSDVQPGTAIVGPGILVGHRRIEGFAKFTGEYMSSILRSAQKFGRGRLGPKFEAAMMKKAREHLGDLVPEVIGTTPTGLIMEHAGQAIPARYQGKALDFINQKWGEMWSSMGEGVRHFDPHLGNVMLRGGRFRIIDWGASSYGGYKKIGSSLGEESVGPVLSRESVDIGEKILETYTTNKKAELAAKATVIRRTFDFPVAPGETTTIDKIGSKTRTIDPVKWEQLHKEAQVSASIAAAQPGRKHLRSGNMTINQRIGKGRS